MRPISLGRMAGGMELLTGEFIGLLLPPLWSPLSLRWVKLQGRLTVDLILGWRGYWVVSCFSVDEEFRSCRRTAELCSFVRAMLL
jgi:hypothetical protein